MIYLGRNVKCVSLKPPPFDGFRDPRSICSVIPAPWTDDCRECIIPTCWYCIWLDFPFHVIGFKWLQFADSKSNYPSVPFKPKPYLRWFTTAPRLLMIGGLKMSLGTPMRSYYRTRPCWIPEALPIPYPFGLSIVPHRKFGIFSRIRQGSKEFLPLADWRNSINSSKQFIPSNTRGLPRDLNHQLQKERNFWSLLMSPVSPGSLQWGRVMKPLRYLAYPWDSWCHAV